MSRSPYRILHLSPNMASFSTLSVLSLAALGLASYTSALEPSQDVGLEMHPECYCKAEFTIRAFPPYSAIALINPMNGQCANGVYVDDPGDEEPPALIEGCDSGEGCQFGGVISFIDPHPFGGTISPDVPAALPCADFQIIEVPAAFGTGLAGVMAVKCGACAPLGG